MKTSSREWSKNQMPTFRRSKILTLKWFLSKPRQIFRKVSKSENNIRKYISTFNFQFCGILSCLFEFIDFDN